MLKEPKNMVIIIKIIVCTSHVELLRKSLGLTWHVAHTENTISTQILVTRNFIWIYIEDNARLSCYTICEETEWISRVGSKGGLTWRHWQRRWVPQAVNYFNSHCQLLIGLVELSMNKEFLVPTLSVFCLRTVQHLKKTFSQYFCQTYTTFFTFHPKKGGGGGRAAFGIIVVRVCPHFNLRTASLISTKFNVSIIPLAVTPNIVNVHFVLH